MSTNLPLFLPFALSVVEGRCATCFDYAQHERSMVGTSGA